MKWLEELQAIPPGSLGRRIGLAVALAIGVTMTAAGSMFWGLMGPIPIKGIPDIRPLVTLGSGLFLGLYAAGGGAARRKLALWGVVLYVIGFHLEEATVHWIAPYPGSITGSRVGFLGTAGSLVALAAVLLMHVEVEHGRLAKDLKQRGAESAGAEGAADTLRRLGVSRILGVAAGIAGLALLVRVSELMFGDQAAGGVYILFVGAALLLVLAYFLVRSVPRSA